MSGARPRCSRLHKEVCMGTDAPMIVELVICVLRIILEVIR